jgi:hypothetical protein
MILLEKAIFFYYLANVCGIVCCNGFKAKYSR